MDYEVFLVSRIYEEWHRRRNNTEAVAHGLAATGSTITAAAAIMVLVFASFILGGERIIELFGVGLATAVLLDALIVRSVLVPALMILIGDANWKLPHWLNSALPQVNVEGRGAARPERTGVAPEPEPAAGWMRGGRPARGATHTARRSRDDAGLVPTAITAPTKTNGEIRCTP
jgi:RND superfamily putative drug exporter